MPITATKIQEGDPQYEAGQDKYLVDGSFDAGSVVSVRLPCAVTLEQASRILDQVQKNKAAEVARFDKPIAALNEVIDALRRAGAA